MANAWCQRKKFRRLFLTNITAKWPQIPVPAIDSGDAAAILSIHTFRSIPVKRTHEDNFKSIADSLASGIPRQQFVGEQSLALDR